MKSAYKLPLQIRIDDDLAETIIANAASNERAIPREVNFRLRNAYGIKPRESKKSAKK